jgi:F-type H+-transporting ATPase subunit b
MGELLSSLGINWQLFVAQLVNFSILLYVLYRFVYTPVLRMLDERSQKIEQGLKDAEASHKKLEEITQKEKAVLIEAKKEAKAIIEKADEQSQINRDEIVAAAKEESEKMLQRAQKMIDEQKAQMVSEVKADIASLVSLAVEKVIDEKMDPEKDRVIIDRVIK